MMFQAALLFSLLVHGLHASRRSAGTAFQAALYCARVWAA